MKKHNGGSKTANAVLRLPESSGDPSHPVRIAEMLGATNGVLRVEVNHLTNVVSIEYDDKTISLEKIKTILKDTG